MKRRRGKREKERINKKERRRREKKREMTGKEQMEELCKELVEELRSGVIRGLGEGLARRGMSQAIFKRMNPSPPGPYIVPELTISFCPSCKRRVMASEPILGNLSRPDRFLRVATQDIAVAVARKSGKDIRNSPTSISAKHRAMHRLHCKRLSWR